MKGLDFADDVAIISESNDSLQLATTNLANEARKVELQKNLNKSEVLGIGKTDMDVDVNIEASQLETAQKFTYLGIPRHAMGMYVESELTARIIRAASVFRNLGPI